MALCPVNKKKYTCVSDKKKKSIHIFIRPEIMREPFCNSSFSGQKYHITQKTSTRLNNHKRSGRTEGLTAGLRDQRTDPRMAMRGRVLKW